MVSEELRTWSIRHKIGWWVLVATAGASVVNHPFGSIPRLRVGR